MATRNSPGRPLLFENVEELQNRIEAYFMEMDREEDTRIFEHESSTIEEFDDVDKNNVFIVTRRAVCPRCKRHPSTKGCVLVQGEQKLKRPYTVTGLAVWLDCSRKTLLNYEFKEEFFPTIKAAKERIENFGEECLYDNQKPTKGVIFSLSNNHEEWADKTETVIDDKRDAAKDLADTFLARASEDGDTPADAEAPNPDTDPADTPAGGRDGAVPAVLPPGVPDGAVPVSDSGSESPLEFDLR